MLLVMQSTSSSLQPNSFIEGKVLKNTFKKRQKIGYIYRVNVATPSSVIATFN